jgi:hypothetical protein
MHVLPSQQLYFQQLWPLASCDANDGRLVGQLLVDLVDSKPDNLAHVIRTFANRMSMLREADFPMGEFLVALISARNQSAPQIVATVVADHVSVTKEQAINIGRNLASCQPRAAALRRAVDSLSVLRTMRSRYIWFLPMLEVLLVQAAEPERRRSTIAARLLGSRVTPDPSPEAIAEETANFDPVVRTEASHVLRSHAALFDQSAGPSARIVCRRQYRPR